MSDEISLKTKKILFVSHDGNRAGAQLFLLQVVRYFHTKNHDCHVLFLGDGELIHDFNRYAKTYVWQSTPKRNVLISKFKVSKASTQDSLTNFLFDWVYVNTVAASPIISWLKSWNKSPLVAHIHELQYSISMYSTIENRTQLFQGANRIIACSNSVRDNLLNINQIPEGKLITIHSFIDNQRVLERISQTKREDIRGKYGISTEKFCVVSCGNAEWRKGIDLFLLVAAQHAKEKSNLPLLFVWVGMPQEGILWEQVMYDVKRLGLDDICLFIPPIPHAIDLIASMDVFLLPSREDPFPLVMLEAALAEKPIIGFEHTGGCTEFVGEEAGMIVPYGDTQKMYREIVRLYEYPIIAQAIAQKALENVRTKYTFDASMLKIEQLMIEMTQP